MTRAELILLTNAILDMRALAANAPPEKAATLYVEFFSAVEEYAKAVRAFLTPPLPCCTDPYLCPWGPAGTKCMSCGNVTP
jgi:hypothetical protein